MHLFLPEVLVFPVYARLTQGSFKFMLYLMLHSSTMSVTAGYLRKHSSSFFFCCITLACVFPPCCENRRESKVVFWNRKQSGLVPWGRATGCLRRPCQLGFKAGGTPGLSAAASCLNADPRGVPPPLEPSWSPPPHPCGVVSTVAMLRQGLVACGHVSQGEMGPARRGMAWWSLCPWFSWGVGHRAMPC